MKNLSRGRVRALLAIGIAAAAVVAVAPVPARAQSGSASSLQAGGNTPTVEQLMAQVQALVAQVQALQAQLAAQSGGGGGGGGSEKGFCYTWTRNLRIGDRGGEGSDMWALRQALQKEGIFFGKSDIETSGSEIGLTYLFGEETASAISEFQEKYDSEILAPNGLRRGSGYVGPSTRAKLNALYPCKMRSTNLSIPPAQSNLFIVPSRTVIDSGEKVTLRVSALQGAASASLHIYCPTSKISVQGAYGEMCNTERAVPAWYTAHEIIPINTDRGEKKIFVYFSTSLPGNPQLQVSTEIAVRPAVVSQQPYITRVVAPAGADFEVYPGERFSIEGTNLEGSSLAVYFAHNGKDLAQVTQRGDTLIWAIAPPDLVPGNTYALYVANERGVSNPVQVKAQGSSAARPSITVLSPNGGESFGVGDRMVITWNTGNFPANARVAIQLAQKIPNGYYGQAPIALDTPNTGRFEWLIPTTIPVSTHYAVSIQGPNGGEEGKGAQDYSNNEFSISGGEPIVIEVSPNSVPIGGTVRVTVDTTRAGITGEIGAVLVQLYSLDDQQYIPNKWATKSSVANQWFADFAVPSTVTPGTWKVMGVDVFNNDSVQKIVGKYQHGFEINKTFTITAPASSGGGSGGGGAATIGLSPGNDYYFRGPVALQQLSDGGFMLSSTPANRPDELFFFANNPPAATDSASDTYYRLQDGNWYKVGGGVTVIDASTQTSSYFVVRKNSLYAGSVLTLPSSVTYFGSTVMNASPRPWQ